MILKKAMIRCNRIHVFKGCDINGNVRILQC